jgi:MFS family permease
MAFKSTKNPFTTVESIFKQKIFYGWWIVLACFLISLFIGSTVFFGLTAFFEPLMHEFGWSRTQLSFAASLRGLEMGILAPLIGFLVDRFGPRKLMICGVLTVGAGLMLLSQTQTLPMFYSAYILMGFGAGGCTTMVLMVVIANWFKKKIGIAMGITASGFGASGLLIPFIVRLIDAYNWRAALIIMGMGVWILGTPLSLIIRNNPEDTGHQPDGLPPAPCDEKNSDDNLTVFLTFKEILKTRTFFFLGFLDFTRMLAASAVILHVMPYLSDLGFSRSIGGWIAGAVPLISVIGRISFGWMGDFFEKRRVMTASYGLMTIGLLLFCFVQEWWLVVFFLLFFSTGFGGSMVLRNTILREYFGTHALGRLVGIILGAAAIGGIIGPTMAGWVYDTLKDYYLIWMVFVGILMLSVGLSMLVKPINESNSSV